VIDANESDMLALGAEFGQDAIFALTPADRRIVSCAGKRVTVTGWSSEREAEEIAERVKS
jgi:hypothetical protein